jgi:malate dehydrogenase (oxaloacetate-decarboxylating)(NADP+)
MRHTLSAARRRLSLSRSSARPLSSAGADDGQTSAGAARSIPWVRTVISGVELLRSPRYNKGMAFTEAERDRLYLRGLLPPSQMSQELQVQRVLTNVRALATPLEKYQHLVALQARLERAVRRRSADAASQERNERLFYATLCAHPAELKHIIYAPTVGQACLKYGLLFRRPRGLFVSIADKGRVYKLLKNWPEKQVRLICLTDGERVLGLGDLGIQGMGIAASKVACYTAFGGVDPATALPVSIDAGTDNEALLQDPFYIGLRHRRVRGEAYDELIDEFIQAAKRRWGNTVLFQFEDFGNANGRRLLNGYRAEVAAFSDDIQGTAAAMLAGVLAALPQLRPGGLGGQTFLFAGAGETGAGMADLLALAVSKATKAPLTEARKAIWLFDRYGLVTRDRAQELEDHKLPWAHPAPEGAAACSTLLHAVNTLRPSCLIGIRRHGFSYGEQSALAAPPEGSALFTRDVLEAMALHNPAPSAPLVFALSRPIQNTECSAAEAHSATAGRVVYASGCLQPSVPLADGVFAPLNSTSCYIFPGVALGAMISGARHIRDDAMLAAAEALAAKVSEEDRRAGSVYPAFERIRDVSAHVARAVAAASYDAGLASCQPRPRDLLATARAWQWDPAYPVYGGGMSD